MYMSIIAWYVIQGLFESQDKTTLIAANLHIYPAIKQSQKWSAIPDVMNYCLNCSIPSYLLQVLRIFSSYGDSNMIL